ncbi:AAC(3) family N-acetyltransferase [Paenibacillus sp. HJGM_3]|uniref:AAC(3) family N-acetyltransferase n=1 Tax=Paenibacillus sp. HJGM_3 TaxID=3379816 RepID=UPI00385B3510
MADPLQKQSLVQSFQKLGISRGDRLVVHSALRSLGPVDGGADTVLDALLEVLGEEGLLVVPTFTYNSGTFDTERSPSRTGILTERLRLRAGAVRSFHPTHSVAAIGRGAESVCEGHHRLPGLGKDTPLDRVAKAGGRILLLGVGHTSNSTVHVGEAYAGAPYADIPFNPAWPTRIQVTGAAELTVDVHEPPGCSRAFGAIEARLRARGAIRDIMIGGSLIQLVPGQAVIDSAVEQLRHDAASLLCTDPACYRCSQARKRIAESQTS